MVFESFKDYIIHNYNLPKESKISMLKSPKKYKVAFLEETTIKNHLYLYGSRIDIKNKSCEKIAIIILPCFLFLCENFIIIYYIINK